MSSPNNPEKVSADSLDTLDGTGEDATNDPTTTKRLYAILAGVVALIIVALVLMVLFVFPGFLRGSDAEPAGPQEQVSITERSDASGRWRIGDSLRVISHGTLTNVTITEFTSSGALAEDDSGTPFIVTQNQLDRYANENPKQFYGRITTDGAVTPKLDPTTTATPQG